MAFRPVELFETAEQEVARLAAAPVGSIYHGLSNLPVNISGNLEGQIVRLPRLPYVDGTVSDRTIVVVPAEYSSSQRNRSKGSGAPFRRHSGHWKCVVVYSDHPRYPVGGHVLSIPEAEIVRGTIAQLILEPAPKPDAPTVPHDADDELIDADPDCQHNVVDAQSGVKCTKCPGWFCF